MVKQHFTVQLQNVHAVTYQPQHKIRNQYNIEKMPQAFKR